ncbi:putative protein S-acyltransferase 19-like [Dorcoceras hygrometricum]|uniref:Uncharacterized protein n=1 Tax=Dorcoceras hygrometricum TaxID=472368 RepID=A0A2Z6ZUE9_9LAMI|nr:putative protein S-acyltransferase 19-like [Dorcoceras hygrometricum]
MGLKETGIDQLALHSVHLGYLKILQMGNIDPNNTKAGKEIRDQCINWQIISVSLYTRTVYQPEKSSVRDLQSPPVSPSQLGGRHSNPVVTTPMIALDFSGTTHQSASHNVAFNRIINQSVNQAQDVCIYANSIFNAQCIQFNT